MKDAAHGDSVKPASIGAGEARRVALAAQGFGGRRSAGPAGWRRLRGAIARMGLVQLDSVSALIRSHYLPAFSRLGAYDRARLDLKAFDPRRRELFEYWAHEASLLPLATQPLLRWRMARAEQLDGVYGEIARLVRERPAYIAAVLAEIEARGPLSAREIGGQGSHVGAMWAWHEGKVALEYLFWSGRLSAATRRGFERVYDLAERVLPAAVLDLPTPDEADAQRALLRIAGRALGIATEADLRDYFRLSAVDAKPRLAELVEAGDLVPARVEGWRQPAYLDPAARVPRRLRATALLSPFDPLIWSRARAQRLFGFRYRLEIYVPAAKRRHGYYVLPFLHDERLVARLDLKSDRAAGCLRVPGAFAEAGVTTDNDVAALAGALGRLAAWLGLERVVLGRRGDLIPALADHDPRP